MAANKIVQGVFAINKPPSTSSAQVIRDAQEHFKQSRLFQPWLEREQANRDAESHNQKSRRRKWHHRQPIQVKMGHGGTLDPEATGVLILGVGSGTKKLNTFLECTKSYECVVLFGAATDTYDAVGKVVARKPFDHVSREKVEEVLSKFRGEIMQRPPIFSALRVQGKRLYEYAREGKEVPVEIEERRMRVDELEMMEWYDGGTHEFHWPVEEAEKPEKEVVDKVLNLKGDGPDAVTQQSNTDAESNHITGSKRKQADAAAEFQTEDTGSPPLKQPRLSSDNLTSNTARDEPLSSAQELNSSTGQPLQPESSGQVGPKQPCPAPACRIRMTVTSGFYVRSFCHDLGAAMDSLGLMSFLVRTRQGEFELGKNVLDYGDLAKGEEVWGPQVESMLDEWMEGEGNSEIVRSEQEQQGFKSNPSTGAKPRRNSSSDDD